MRRTIWTLSAIGFALVLGGVAFGSFAGAADEPVGRDELISFLRRVRLTEGALVGFPDAPSQASASPGNLIAKADLRKLYVKFSSSRQSRRSPDWLANAALITLVDGNLDSAIDLLNSAVRISPGDSAPFWSDLSAVYLERARVKNQAYDLFLALAAAEQACKGGGFWEARFNRALALERLHLEREASLEWKRLVAEAPSADWKNEIEVHWRNLQPVSEVPTPTFDVEARVSSFERRDSVAFRNFVGRYSQEVRAFGEEVLLVRWAQLHDREPARAEADLDLAEAIGERLELSHGDHMLADTVHVIRSAEQDVSGETLQLLLKGHRGFGRGFKAFMDVDCAVAGTYLEAAERDLKRVRSPFANWAGFYMAICSYFNQDFAKAEVRVVDLLNGDLQPYPTFEARVQWLQGMLQLSRSDPVQSLRAYLRSLDLFERTGESGNVAVLNSLIAENLLHLGQKETAWNFRMQALLILRQKGSTRSQTILDEAAEAALYEGQYKVARYFQDEVVASVIKKGEPHPVAEAYLRRIPIQVRLGAREQAEADFQATLASARRIPDPPLRDRLEADALVAVNGARDAEVALAGLNRAVTLYERSDYHFRLVEVRRLRAKIFESLGRMSEAEADLYQALHEVEEEVQKVQDDFRESYLHDADPLFDDMIRFMAQPGRSGVTSLWYAERERLLSLPRANATRFPVITEWEPWLTSAQRFLPEDTVLFEFSVLDKEILVWVLDRREVRSFVVEMSKDKLDALINRLNVSLTSPKGFRRVSSALFNYLVRSGLTRPYRKIVFVPDKRLWEVPFSALYDEQTNRYLIEESLVAVAPSATLIMSEDRKLEEVKVPSILAFGDPAFDPRLALMLPRLKGAKFEALAAAALYPESSHSVFLGEAATVEAFVRYAPLKEVVHFSGHAVVADTSPFLLFAPSMSHPAGTLGVQEISQLDLRKTHIVILAGCRTARVPRAEGLASLSAAFLAAGVSEVIGSLWKVDDSITEQFFVEFHRHVAKGRSGEEALRRTQLLMLNRDVPESLPASWAGFQIMRRAYVPS